MCAASMWRPGMPPGKQPSRVRVGGRRHVASAPEVGAQGRGQGLGDVDPVLGRIQQHALVRLDLHLADGQSSYAFGGLAEEQDESTGDPPWQIQVIVEEEAPQGFERGTKCGRSPDPEADAGRPLLGADEAGQA